jgi:hypothetical protein
LLNSDKYLEVLEARVKELQELMKAEAQSSAKLTYTATSPHRQVNNSPPARTDPHTNPHSSTLVIFVAQP